MSEPFDNSPPLFLQCREDFTPQEFTTLVIEPVLCAMDRIPYSKAAAQLLLATALTESGGFRHRTQVGGPALSYYQVEPATYDDIYKSYLDYRTKLKRAVLDLSTSDGKMSLYQLCYNDNYATAIARLKYYRAKEKMPEFDDIDGMANYWKTHYNSSSGKGTVEKFLRDWETYNGHKVVFRESCDDLKPEFDFDAFWWTTSPLDNLGR